MLPFYYLTREDILDIHTQILAESNELERDGILNENNLLNAIESPHIKVYGQEIYPDPISKIGTFMFEMITLHPFIEGNKRTGLMCADTLMVLNYGVITASDRQRKNVALSSRRIS